MFVHIITDIKDKEEVNNLYKEIVDYDINDFEIITYNLEEIEILDNLNRDKIIDEIITNVNIGRWDKKLIMIQCNDLKHLRDIFTYNSHIVEANCVFITHNEEMKNYRQPKRIVFNK